jgi:multidrug efflux pump subunit AcrA (membrane-fusion protein)
VSLLSTPRVIVAGLVIAALALGALIARDTLSPSASQTSAPRLMTVSVGTVRASVSGTGTVVPAAQVNLNFRVAGQLQEVDVKVGDHVKAGQQLAALDPRSQQIALDQARANLQTAQANLQSALSPLTAEQLVQLQHNLSNAQTSYNDSANSVALTNQQDAAAVAADQNQLNSDQAQLNIDQAALDANPTYQFDKQKLAQDQAKLASDHARYTADGCFSNPNTPQCQADQAAINADELAIAADQQRIVADEAQVNADKARVNTDNAKLALDLAKQQTDLLAGQTKLNSAQAAVTTAQDALTVQSQSKPNSVAAAQASVAFNTAQVQSAQYNLDQTRLNAPIDGVIASISGLTGESVSAGASVTPQSPGSTAPQPSSSSGTGSAASSPLMVIASDSAFVAVVPFAEADAARLAASQNATLTFDAIPSVSLSGQVLAVSAVASVVSNVVNYYATVVLTRADPHLKAGMTTNAAVVVAQAQSVLAVPNQAITRQGGQASVLVYADGQQVRTPIEIGIQGDTTSEVTAGLRAGDRIVLPAPRTGQTAPAQRGGGLGGLGR